MQGKRNDNRFDCDGRRIPPTIRRWRLHHLASESLSNSDHRSTTATRNGRRAGGIEHVDESNVARPGGGHKAGFISWRWEPMKNLPGLIVPFKRPVYERVVREFAKLAGS
jgi:hypothetical protein